MNEFEYTSRDFPTNVAALIEIAKKVLPGQWTSFSDADFGRALIELIAWDHSVLSFVQDQQARDSFLSLCFSYEAGLLHAAQNGYRPRWGYPASVDVWAEIVDNPDPTLPFPIRDGTIVRQDNGLTWEVVGNQEIPANRRWPAKQVLAWSQIASSGQPAYLTIRKGSSQAILTDENGIRLPSEISFRGRGISPGNILTLTGQLISGNIGAPPVASLREFAIVSVSGYAGDLLDGGILFLDRVWSGDTDFTGSFLIESRSLTLSQGQTREESFQVPDERKGAVVQTTFPGISSLAIEAFAASGSFNSTVNSVRVAVDGRLWHEVEALSYAGPSETAYETFVDADQRLNVRFGDGINGAELPPGGSIAVGYRTSSGAKGNIQRGTFSGTLPIVSADGRSATISLSNPYNSGTGGSDRESLSQLKANIMASIRSNDRAVTPKDFESLALGFRSPRYGSIAAAQLVKPPSAAINNVIAVHCWSRTASGQLGTPTQGLMSDLRSYLQERAMMTDEVVVAGGRMINFPIAVRYRFSGLSESDAFEAVRSSINGVLTSQKPGTMVQLGDLYDAVESVVGIDGCTFMTPSQSLPPKEGVYVNSLQRATITKTTSQAAAGTRQLILDVPASFLALGQFSVWALDRLATTGLIESVDESQLTARYDCPLNDGYPVGSVVANSDYWAVGHNLERTIDLFISLDSGSQDRNHLRSLISTKLHNLFRWFVLPGDTVFKTELEKIITTVPNVISADISFNAPNAHQVQYVSSSPLEKLVLRDVKFT